MSLRCLAKDGRSIPAQRRAGQLRCLLLGACWACVAPGCLQSQTFKGVRADTPTGPKDQAAAPGTSVQQVTATSGSDSKPTDTSKDKAAKEPGFFDSMIDSLPLVGKPKAPPPPVD